MKFCQEIKKGKVLARAMQLITTAKKTVDMTMDMVEEIAQPLPKKYHRNLVFLVKKGIKINRYAFGPKKLLKIIKGKYSEINLHYGGSLKNYQRMLIVDKNKGLFALGNQVFYTSFEPLVNSLLNYAKIE